MKGNKGIKKSTLLWAAVAAFLLLFAEESLAQTSNYPCWGMGSSMMVGAMGWIGGIFSLLFWVLLLIVLVLFIRWLVGAGANRSRVLPGPNLPQGPVESALDILKKRYARGEITREQFESMRRDIE